MGRQKSPLQEGLRWQGIFQAVQLDQRLSRVRAIGARDTIAEAGLVGGGS